VFAIDKKKGIIKEFVDIGGVDAIYFELYEVVV
jgi:hypothetical protein